MLSTTMTQQMSTNVLQHQEEDMAKTSREMAICKYLFLPGNPAHSALSV